MQNLIRNNLIYLLNFKFQLFKYFIANMLLQLKFIIL